MVHYQSVIDFWFEELTPLQRYERNENLDLQMIERFITLHSSVVAAECSLWRSEPLGRLAEIIVIDQFSRNIYRDEPKSFIYDSMALVLAQEAIRDNSHKNFKPEYKQFLYMPFMHSESPIIHNTAMLLFSEVGLENSFEYELKHKAIIDRFGRYPHRNKILARPSTPEEDEFIKQTGAIVETNSGSWRELNV